MQTVPTGNTMTGAPEWDSWQWHMTHSITTLDELRRWIRVTPREEAAIEACEGKYRWRITPYYASLMDPDDAQCPVRLQAVPQLAEMATVPGTDIDPVGDGIYRKTNRVVHKYPDRVGFLVTALCPVYCRHCTRKYHTTDVEGTYFAESEAASMAQDFRYIAEHPEVREVLLTGGDPLTYSDRRIEAILAEIRKIPHVEVIRVGSRYPVLLPCRITPEFCAMLDRYHPIWFQTHFNHPKELTPTAAAACDRLLRHGIPVMNQSVLLKGINDDLATMRSLVTGLVKMRVRPYYLLHCDNVTGVSHFMTSVDTGREIMAGLLGHTSGICSPRYIITTAIGKIPIEREYVTAEDGGYVVENYEGRTLRLSGLLESADV